MSTFPGKLKRRNMFRAAFVYAAGLGLLMPALAGAQPQPQSPRFGLSSGSDEPPLETLEDAVQSAAPDDVFSVRMALAAPARLSRLREVALQLQIPRVLAFVELASVIAVGPRWPRSRLPPIGLGVLYETAGAWQRETCQAEIVAAMISRGPPPTVAANDWLVREIHVYGSAYAIRELQTGAFLPRARLTSGVPQERRYLRALAAAVDNALSQPIRAPDGADVPPECESLVRPYDSPVLTGGSVPPVEELAGADFRAILQRQLAELAPETPVTLELEFRERATPEVLAELVGTYRMDGLDSEFSPSSIDEIIPPALVIVDMSIYGPALSEQSARADCLLALAAVKRPYFPHWSTKKARVSLRAARVWDLLSAEVLENARLSGTFKPGALARIADYHRRRFAQPIPIKPKTQVPAGCERFVRVAP